MPFPLLVILLALFVGAPLVLLRHFLTFRTITLQVRQRGLHTRGKVLRVQNSKTRSTSTVHYSFRPVEGPEVEDQFTESAEEAASKRAPGSPLDIAYLPENPRHHLREDVGFERPQVILVILLVLSFALCGGSGVLGGYLRG